MTCLYECIYIATQTIGREDSLEIITSSLGFSIEAHIPSRSWLLCGQSDVEYYAPQLNRNVKTQWLSLPFSDLISFVQHEKQRNYPVIVETESSLIPYYNQSSLGTGMPHAFLIFDYNPTKHQFFVYDRLAPDISFPKDQRGCFWVQAQLLESALQNKLFYLEFILKNSVMPWEEELSLLLRRSSENMHKQVSRAQENYQAFGFQGLKVFSNALRNFRQDYQDDAQSIWLMNHYLPVNILQSVYGNRLLFRKILDGADAHFYAPAIEALEHSLAQWSVIRKAFTECANGKLSYVQLADKFESTIETEKNLIDLLEQCEKISV